MRIAIIGRTQILYETVLKLHEEGHDIGCIITSKAAPEYTRDEDDFKDLAKEVDAFFFLTRTLNKPEILQACRGLDLGISMNWVSIIKQNYIDLFRLGILNSHHGDLPRYRGNASSNWAIIRNEEQITNTIHFMEGGKLDCGRIISQQHYKLNNDTCITDIYKWAEESGPKLFVQAIQILEKNDTFTLKYADPNSSQSFRCYPRLPEDSYINWNLPVSEVHNLIRALCFPFSGAYTFLRHNGEIKKLFVLKSRIILTKTKDIAVPGHVIENNLETGESLVQCGDGVIALLECRYDGEDEGFAPGKNWKSIRMRLGVRAEDWLWEIYKANK